MKVLIIEDEVPAYEKLRQMVHQTLPMPMHIDWTRSVKDTIAFLQKEPPVDLIFSDIQLLDGLSFEIFETQPIECPIIFCTGFDQFLLRAFRTNGIGYLLKPFTAQQIQEALDKFQNLFNHNPKIDPVLISSIKEALLKYDRSYKKRFTIKKRNGIKLVETNQIKYFEANGDFCILIDHQEQKHSVNMSLTSIEEKVDPQQFFRVNRSQLINIAFIDKIQRYHKNKLSISLRQHEQIIFTSSTTTAQFRKWLDGEGQ